MKNIILRVALLFALIVIGAVANATVTSLDNIQLKQPVKQLNTNTSTVNVQTSTPALMFAKGQICSRVDNDSPVRCGR